MAAAMNWLEWVLNMMRSLRPLEYGESNEFVTMAAELGEGCFIYTSSNYYNQQIPPVIESLIEKKVSPNSRTTCRGVLLIAPSIFSSP